MDILLLSLGSAAGVLALVVKLNPWRAAGYWVSVDVITTITLVVLFSGTYQGTITAMLAGLWISLALWVWRYFFGYLRFELGRGWVYYNGRSDHTGVVQ